MISTLCVGCQTAQNGQSSVEMLEPIPHAEAASNRKVEVYRDLSVDRDPPELVGELTKPLYPADALAAHAGLCVIYATITIDAKGRVSEVIPSWDRVNIPNRYSERFFEAVTAAVASWNFVPARLVHWERHPDGNDKYLYSEIVPAQVDVRFTFEATGNVR
jgi:hypothetical protein